MFAISTSHLTFNNENIICLCDKVTICLIKYTIISTLGDINLREMKKYEVYYFELICQIQVEKQSKHKKQRLLQSLVMKYISEKYISNAGDSQHNTGTN